MNLSDKHLQVLDYIKQRNESETNFRERKLHGECYEFAYELVNVFDGKIYMNEPRDHVVAFIDGRLFDATGSISSKHMDEFHLITKSENVVASQWKY